MPELPEVEVVRAGLQRWVAGRTIADVQVQHPRAVRRHEAGPADLAQRLAGRTVRCASRRGKYLWLPMGDEALVIHLGMSGQVLLQTPEDDDETHLRVRVRFEDGGRQMRFVDQRTFGGLHVDALVDDDAGGRVPASVRHIARDPLDPLFGRDRTIRTLRDRRTEIKRALLDQGLVSGIGNIYADEALWRARLHGRRLTQKLSRRSVDDVLSHVTEVMHEALEQGGTSFDALYVNVNGQSGYFSRSLNAYGREGEPCARCGSPIRREAFMNRSSFSCPSCQPTPSRRHRVATAGGGPREGRVRPCT
jgi:formamidopyrimidine-DNA glycosylase